MSAPVTFTKKVAASDMKLAATCLSHMKKIFLAFWRWELHPRNSQKVGNTSERPRCGIQRGFVGTAVSDRQGGYPPRTEPGTARGSDSEPS